MELRPDHFVSPLASIEVGPKRKSFAAPSGIIQSLRCGLEFYPKPTYVVEDNVEDIFGHILQYLHSGDYSVLVPASDESGHAECKIRDRNATRDSLPLIPLKGNYFSNYEEEERVLKNPISLPHCGDGDHLCKHPETILAHARLYVFATRYELDRLQLVSLHKLYWTLSEIPLDVKDVEAIVEVLRISHGTGVIDELMIHFVSLHLKTLMCFSNFTSFLQEDLNLSSRLLKYLCDSLRNGIQYQSLDYFNLPQNNFLSHSVDCYFVKAWKNEFVNVPSHTSGDQSSAIIYTNYKNCHKTRLTAENMKFEYVKKGNICNVENCLLAVVLSGVILGMISAISRAQGSLEGYE